VTLVANQAAAGSNLGPQARHSLDRLGDLAAVLAAHGLATKIVTPAGRLPRLHATNPAVPRLCEDVYAACGPDGSGWFWWPWAERIAPDDDVPAAAAAVAKVLRLDGRALDDIDGPLSRQSSISGSSMLFATPEVQGTPGSGHSTGPR